MKNQFLFKKIRIIKGVLDDPGVIKLIGVDFSDSLKKTLDEFVDYLPPGVFLPPRFGVACNLVFFFF